MKYVIVSPAHVVSGGPELTHQMCHEISINGNEAFMYYVFRNTTGPADVLASPEYKQYTTKHICSHDEADTADTVVIVPEGLADRAYAFKNAIIVIWWMSVDNFYRDNKNHSISELDGIASLHLSQSEYSRQHLIEKGVSMERIMMLTDYINEEYGQFILPADYRQNIALYNPKKGLDEIVPIIKRTEMFDWRPIYNLTREEVIVLMELAKVYVDFGNHPGKDRLPREAAVSGCCILTNRSGSAAFSEDVSIPEEYKFNMDEEGYDAAVHMLEQIYNGYKSKFEDFEEYRSKIHCEKEQFKSEVQSFLSRMEEL